jgi:hypothetical protein
MHSRLLPRSLDDIAPLQRTRIEQPTFLLCMPLPFLVDFGFALFASFILDTLGGFDFFFLSGVRFDLGVESFHVCRTQDPRFRENIPPVFRNASPKDDFLIRVFDEKDALELDLPFSELGDRALDFENRADVDWFVVDEERRQTPRVVHVQVVNQSVRRIDLSIVKSGSMPSRDFHFYRPPTAVIQHEQSILDRASTRRKIELLYETTQVDVLYRMVVVEIDVLA